jgi:hypothetical protein
MESFRFADNVIRIEPTAFFHPKSEHSIDDVEVGAELMEILRGFYARADKDNPFVIEIAPNSSTTLGKAGERR